jgi:hypothetical protein
MRVHRRFAVVLSFLLSAFLLGACQSPCASPPDAGFLRHLPATGLDFRLQFDHPVEWIPGLSENPDQRLTFEKPDPIHPGRNAFLLIALAPMEHYPNIVSGGKLDSHQDWGDPFPTQPDKTVARKEFTIDGHPALRVSIDFSTPMILKDPGPVNSWGYMENVFLLVENNIYDIKFFASDLGEKALLRRQFDKLIASMCVIP